MERIDRFGCPMPETLAAVTDRRYSRAQPPVPADPPQKNTRWVVGCMDYKMEEENCRENAQKAHK
jgi:hypothetical protein